MQDASPKIKKYLMSRPLRVMNDNMGPVDDEKVGPYHSLHIHLV